jgi:hypothetical protein
MVKGDPGYTWFHKNEFATVPHPSPTPDHSPGCSATSPYPVRSDWVAVADSAGHSGCVQRRSTPTPRAWPRSMAGCNWRTTCAAGASESSYYKLVFVPMTTANPLDPDNPVARERSLCGSRLNRQRRSQGPALGLRSGHRLPWQGKPGLPAELLREPVSGRGRQDNPDHSPPRAHLESRPPFGVDTMILLSTAQPLPDPSVLNFEGVARGGCSRSQVAAGTASLQHQRRIARTWRRGGSPDQLGD